MGRHFSNLLGTIGILLVTLLWLSLLNPHRADLLANSLAGSQHEYKIVLGVAMLATALSIRGRDSFQVVVPRSGVVIGDASIFRLQSLRLVLKTSATERP